MYLTQNNCSVLFPSEFFCFCPRSEVRLLCSETCLTFLVISDPVYYEPDSVEEVLSI